MFDILVKESSLEFLCTTTSIHYLLGWANKFYFIWFYCEFPTKRTDLWLLLHVKRFFRGISTRFTLDFKFSRATKNVENKI